MKPNQESKKNILFVDDEPNFLHGLRRLLRHKKEVWKMQFAQGVDEALTLVEKTAFDAIISDIQMPVKSGFDLLKSLRNMEQTRYIPVVILTGNSEMDLKRQALALGATDLLNKPVNREDLVARIQSVLRLKWYQDQLKAHNEQLEEKVRQRTRELERSRVDILWRLAKAGEYRDSDTGDHVVRVAECCRLLAEELGLPDPEVEEIFIASPLHDIGKIGISDKILLKPGKLSKEEFRTVQTHCGIGSAILLDAPKGVGNYNGVHKSTLFENAPIEPQVIDPLRKLAATIAMNHHEQWDGSGYPQGLRGEEIPLPGLIVAVTDVFDALRSNRPYKKAIQFDKTMERMRQLNGSHFAPDVFAAFEKVAKGFEEIRNHYST